VPQWVVLLAVAVGSWLALSVIGGLVLGQLLNLLSRRLDHGSQLRVIEGSNKADSRRVGARHRRSA
jgi:hypothetical protein